MATHKERTPSGDFVELAEELDLHVEEPKKSETTLYLVGPFWVTSYVVEDDEGAKLVIDKHGVNVPNGKAASIISDASESGVSIAEASI